VIPPELSTVTPEIEADRRRALRALLRYPLIEASGEAAEDCIRVRRHSDWLKPWLQKFPAWNLHGCASCRTISGMKQNPQSIV
jgi:hypothetical protein